MTEAQTDTDRQTRPTDPQTHRRTDRRQRQRQGQRQTETARRTDGETDTLTNRHTHTDAQTDGHVESRTQYVCMCAISSCSCTNSWATCFFLIKLCQKPGAMKAVRAEVKSLYAYYMIFRDATLHYVIVVSCYVHRSIHPSIGLPMCINADVNPSPSSWRVSSFNMHY